MNRGCLDVSFRSFGGVTARFSVAYPAGGAPTALDLPVALYVTLDDLVAEVHTLLQGVDSDLSCTLSGDTVTVASSGGDFDLFVTSLTLRTWLGLDVPALGVSSVSGRSPMRWLSDRPWGADEHTHVRHRRAASLAYSQVGAVTLSTAVEHQWTVTVPSADLVRFRTVVGALLRGLPGYCRPDVSNVAIWEWDNRQGGFPCVAAPGWRDYADRWAHDSWHLTMQLPVILREIP